MAQLAFAAKSSAPKAHTAGRGRGMSFGGARASTQTNWKKLWTASGNNLAALATHSSWPRMQSPRTQSKTDIDSLCDAANNYEDLSVEDSFDVWVPGDSMALPNVHDGASSYMISPDKRWLLAWKLCMGILAVYSIIAVPFEVAFYESQPVEVCFHHVLDVVFLIDMFVIFRTGMRTDPQSDIDMDSRAVGKHYFSHGFVSDFISSVPWDLMMQNKVSDSRLVAALRLCRVLRVFRLARISTFLQGKITFFSLHVCNLIWFVVKISIVAHLVSCVWRIIGSPRELCLEDIQHGGCNFGHADVTWVTFFHVGRMDATSQYIASLHCIVASMMGVGYGDIYATNSIERIVIIAIQLAGALLFGFILSVIQAFIDPVGKVSSSNDRMRALTEWMICHEIPGWLQTRVREFMRYKISSSSDNELDILEPLGTLAAVKQEVTQSIGQARIASLVAVFSNYNGMDVLICAIVPFMSPQYLEPGDTLYEIDEPVNEIVFIQRGSLEGCVDSKQKEETSGILCFVVGKDHMLPGSVKSEFCALMNFVATARTEIFVLSQLDFIISAETCAASNDAAMKISCIVDEIEKEQVERDTIVHEIIHETEIEGEGRPRKTRIIFNWHVYEANTLPETVETRCSFSDDTISGAAHMIRVRRMRRPSVNSKVSEVVYVSTCALYSRFLIPPNATAKIVWDCFIGILIVYSVLAIPYHIGLRQHVQEPMDLFVDMLFFFDMIASSRTAYVDDEGILETVEHKIRWHYFKKWFFIDFFSTMPFDHIVDAVFGAYFTDVRSIKLIRTARLIRVLKLIRGFKLSKIAVRFKETSLGRAIPRWLETTLELILALFFMAHFFGCFWFYIASPSYADGCESGQLLCMADTETMAWWEAKRISPSDHTAQYVASLYWAFSTMTTVGYGDIIPMSTPSRIYAIFAQLFGASVFGYIIGSIAAATGETGSNSIGEQLLLLSEFGDKHQLPDTLVQSMRRGTRIRLMLGNSIEDEKLIDSLPNFLRTECWLARYKATIAMFPMFGSHPKWLQCLLLRLMEPVGLCAGNPVTNARTHVYCVHTGSFEGRRRKNGAYMVYTPGMMFGALDTAPCVNIRACPKILPKDAVTCAAFTISIARLQSLNDAVRQRLASSFAHEFKEQALSNSAFSQGAKRERRSRRTQGVARFELPVAESNVANRRNGTAKNSAESPASRNATTPATPTHLKVEIQRSALGEAFSEEELKKRLAAIIDEFIASRSHEKYGNSPHVTPLRHFSRSRTMGARVTMSSSRTTFSDRMQVPSITRERSLVVDNVLNNLE